MSDGHEACIQDIVDNIGLEAEIDAIRIYSHDGSVWVSTDRTEIGTKLSPQAPQCVSCHAEAPAPAVMPLERDTRHFKSARGDRVVALTNAIENLNRCKQCHVHDTPAQILGVVEFERTLREADQSTQGVRRTSLFVSALLILLIGLLFGGYIHRLIRRPISRLVEGTSRIAAMDLEYHIPETSKDEIGLLSASFNRMTAELKKSKKANDLWAATLEERVAEKTRELEQAQANLILVDKMASLGKLAGVVAHEINNPLAGILTYSKLSIRRLSAIPECREATDALENLMIISDEAKRAGRIVNSLLHFSKRTYGQKSEVDVMPLAERSIELARHSARSAAILLSVSNESRSTILYCDPAAIEQMLLVFLMNAIEAMPQDGGWVRLTLRDDDALPGLSFEIADNGTGITDEDRAHIFEPYFTTKQSGKNTGLGLSVAYQIIADQHRGSVHVETQPGAGTKFTITLPRTQPKAPASEGITA
jgi:two-component system NtrC family sensor kinase